MGWCSSQVELEWLVLASYWQMALLENLKLLLGRTSLGLAEGPLGQWPHFQLGWSVA